MISNIWNLLIYGPIHNLLTYLYVLSGSLGLSTFTLIVIIRILMWPMVAKQYRDTKKVRAIQPRLDELKEKFKNDPTGMAKAQQEIYKEINYNPLGCFTNFLIQIPILIALYQSVLAFTKSGVTPANMPGLYPYVAQQLQATGQTAFSTDLLGLHLLTTPGSSFTHGIFTLTTLPYLILLILLGLSNILPTWVSTKIMNTQVPKLKKPGTEKSDTEAMQEAFTSSLNASTLFVMPIMITLSMVPLPTIVSVYMIAQNIVSTSQQLLVKYFHDKELRKKLTILLTSQYKKSEAEAKEAAEKLIKLSPAINFLADELGQFGKVKTIATKIHDIPFERVLKRKNDVVVALLTFDSMARDPENAENILNN
ncbi:membrane protein insertase YidC [bacterium]|nr:membrane protein insertase YidC [bacterium]